jgi:predicted phosphoadenosine phosphosulfate sulfurtransferase
MVSQNRPAAVMVGIRADESYNRFLTIANARKQRFADDKPWTTVAPGGHAWYIYPIYDWKTADIWTWFAKTGSSYNPLYNLMFQAGVPRAICAFANLWARAAPGAMALSCCRARALGGHVRTRQRCQERGIYAGHDNHFMATAKILKPDHLAGRNTPCCCSTACRKTRLSITATKSPCICTGIEKACRIFPIRRKGILAQRYSLMAAHLQGTSE